MRVVSIGAPIDEVRADPQNARWRRFSIELCGGTHLAQTAGARRFVVTQEQALAAGIRRITALTDQAAAAAETVGRQLEARARRAAAREGAELLAEVDELGKQLEEQTTGAVARRRIALRLEDLRGRVRAIRKARQAESRSEAMEQARRIASSAQGPAIVDQVPGADRDSLLSALDLIRSKCQGAAIMLFGAGSKKVSIVARVPESLVEKGLEAGDWVRQVAEICGGKGGGRPDMAQAGGNDPARIPEAIAAATAYARRTLK